MANATGFFNTPGTVVETFLWPLLCIVVAILAMGGDIVIRYFISRQEIFKSPEKASTLNENDEASPGIIEVADNALKFFQFKRSRENFNQIRKENFPPKSSKKLRTTYSVGRKVLYTTCSGTGLFRAFRSAILLTCFAGLWGWVMILLQNMSSNEKKDSKLNAAVTQFLEHSRALGVLSRSIHIYGNSHRRDRSGASGEVIFRNVLCFLFCLGLRGDKIV